MNEHHELKDAMRGGSVGPSVRTSVLQAAIGLGIVGLYIVVTLVLLFHNLWAEGGDMGHFFDQMSKANFLLAPVGIVIGYFFGVQKER